jgi:hypothetical protein
MAIGFSTPGFGSVGAVRRSGICWVNKEGLHVEPYLWAYVCAARVL